MDLDSFRSKIGGATEHGSKLTLLLFVLVAFFAVMVSFYVFLFAPVVYFTEILFGFPVADFGMLLTSIGTVLVSLLLATLYWDLLAVQSEQVEIMDEQSGWAEAANSPAVIVEEWHPQEHSGVIFHLSNKGNTHVEKIELLTDLEIKDNVTGEVTKEFHSRSTLTAVGEDGFESRILPANRRETKVFGTGVAFERNTPGGSSRFSTPEVVIKDLLEDRDTALSCEVTMTLKTIAPGGNTDEREVYRFSIGVFEEHDFQYLVDEGKWESRPLHVKPR